MILLTILFVVIAILALCTIFVLASFGAGAILIAGDWIIAIVLIALWIRHVIKKRKQD